MFYSMILLLETGVLGVFLSLDLFLFYLFWDVVLIPMYFCDRKIRKRAARLRGH